MNFKEGKYSLIPHIAEKLIEFPDADLTKKQIQQFVDLKVEDLLMQNFITTPLSKKSLQLRKVFQKLNSI
ncbi:hypothetical protein Goshw_001369 [Gossypium schwendimanii]|uniref:Uncharacterized protein n=1 Tax=Gossypium schwendimanii TaxID=34291 RepID=A0A7J9LJA0_GOSSC|nr:hypothetical protein [Gossypium schwendimanii]